MASGTIPDDLYAGADDVRSVRRGVQPVPQGLAGQQTGHLDTRVPACPVDERDGAPVVVVVDSAVRLRRVRHDLVALTSAGVDDGRVQHVRAKVGDVEHRRVWRGGTAPVAVRVAPREGTEYGGHFPGRVCPGPTAVGRGRVPDAPALNVWVEVGRHFCERAGGPRSDGRVFVLLVSSRPGGWACDLLWREEASSYTSQSIREENTFL